MLKLTAELKAVGNSVNTINLSSNGKLIGTSAVLKEHADELVGILNAATDLLAIAQRVGNDCCTCWRDATRDTPCCCCAARHVVAKVKGAT